MGLNGIDESPAAVVRRQYLASSAGDLAALRETLAPDVEWTEMAGFPLAGTVVVLARYTATHKATGNPLNVRVAHHFTVRGGKIVRFEQFVDTALVRDAAQGGPGTHRS
ncbi:hypothetical protein LTV02_36740 [Nocardia yamanashiensis]|uniref:nuclear transport factor 2 family protein n=1 Tax=Nocardia yamanashiensis TaxID=209247 RepID=UPI001E5FF755|nr:nuclear transport factor 2 family protein [Nocardia yamanashiensis]UGT41416.1 hypothetical protein LTV02_36740 [Nocardia yamanashiensis]